MKAYADSLQHALGKEDNDSIKAQIHIQLINYWLYRDTTVAHKHLMEGRALSVNYPYLYGMSYYAEGLYYFNSDAGKSVNAYLKADTILGQLKTREAYIARSNLWNNIAVQKQRKDDDRGHVDVLLNKAIPLAEKAKDSATMAFEYSAVGVSFMNMSQYEKAVPYFNNAINILRHKPSQQPRLVTAYGRAAENYIELNKFPEARAALDSLHAILAPYPDSEHHSLYYMGEGMYYHKLEAYDKAINYFDMGIRSANGTLKDYRIQELNFQKVKTQVAAEKYNDARQLLIKLMNDPEVMDFYGNRIETYDNLAKVYAGLGNMKEAYHWQKEYTILNDSLNDSKLKKDVNALEQKYNNAEKEKRIARLEAENKIALLSARNNRLINWLLGVISVSLLITVILSYSNYKKNKKLAVEKENSYQAQVQKLKQEQQLVSVQAMLKGEERERKRMAQDLHDGLGGILAGVRMNLSEVESKVTQTFQNEIDKIITNVDISLRELRRIAHNLMPETLLRFGLVNALDDLCKSYQAPGINIEFQVYEMNTKMSDNKQLTIYRIIQELLSNALRHSKATEIIVQCSQNKNKCFITVEDNGKGFDPDLPENKKGLGLTNLKNRVKSMKGKLDINSDTEGTIVNIELNVG
ncbi:histidine kinase [Zhouia spongiae]|uniref:histidine kinase n=1 Tax=Zhouia spongiae TaxID=2202721 RepID=A0ABY3YHQ0_9FLAO|nr:ATP-binding protein [Zhouia spongiae]UNY97250.1 histidine kinase [Zhouia spongiae]